MHTSNDKLTAQDSNSIVEMLKQQPQRSHVVTAKTAEHMIRLQAFDKVLNTAFDHDRYEKVGTMWGVEEHEVEVTDKEKYDHLLDSVRQNYQALEGYDTEGNKEYAYAYAGAIGNALTAYFMKLPQRDPLWQPMTHTTSRYAYQFMKYKTAYPRSIVNPWQPIMDLILSGYLVGHCGQLQVRHITELAV